jgi:DNA-binding transcriptional ArsR family regulator
VQTLGYSGYSRRFYEVKRQLKADGVLDFHGRFIENAPNSWLAELPAIVDKQQLRVLGDRVPYVAYLAAVEAPGKVGSLATMLDMTRSSLYHATARLAEAGLVRTIKGEVSAPQSPFREWLTRYLEVCKTHADVTGDVAVLFRAVPAYIDGPRAYYALHRAVGAPIGRTDMLIATPEPFRVYWQGAIRNVRYFREYQKKVEVVVSPSAKVVWVEGLPFNSKARRPGG